MGEVAIYRLDDPAGGPICYVGASRQPELRFKAHLSPTNKTPAIRQWVAELAASGRKPTMTILRRVPEENAGDAEREALHEEIRSNRKPLNGTTVRYGNHQHRRGPAQPLQASGRHETRQTEGRPPTGGDDGNYLAIRPDGGGTLTIEHAHAYAGQNKPIIVKGKTYIELPEWVRAVGALYDIVTVPFDPTHYKNKTQT
jgi:hypothetical protein